MAYAHSRNHHGQRQTLVDHLRGVAALAAQFASPFGAGHAAHILGLWHDIGKFDPRWQQYLLASEADPSLRGTGPDHKAAGALLARQYLQPLALLVQGHHGGLRTRADLRSWLVERADDPATSAAIQAARRQVPEIDPPGPIPLPAHVRHDPRAAEFFLRMLFSALIDADCLDTEAHFSRRKAATRGQADSVSMGDLWARLEAAQQQRCAEAPDTPLNHLRREFYEACVSAAERPPGLFRLTGPTGVGKTLAGLSFALKHSMVHGKRRVIVATPFIAITSQTAGAYRTVMDDDGDGTMTEQIAQIYRDICGPEAVLEHHSSMADEDGDWSRLAAENWDAPIIVTTMVQFFESLLAKSTRRCRRIHNIAHSVVILDEVQGLPPTLLSPLLDGLRELTTNYGTTVVLATATQPTFHVVHPAFGPGEDCNESIPVFGGLDGAVREIVPDAPRYFAQLKRVDYDIRTATPLSWDDVAALMRREHQALAIVNVKRHALDLLAALGDPDALHLSTRLCGAHRTVVLDEVRRRLAAGEPCRLVSTQVVEAGVDIDFPLVLRARGPLDSIIQAAGRCNREGRLAGLGRVIVFTPLDERMPQGYYATAAGISASLLAQGRDLSDHAVAQEYYQRLYEVIPPDREGIQALREGLDYPGVAEKCRLIKDNTESVIITAYGSEEEQANVQEWIALIKQQDPDSRTILRKLQPFIVSMPWYIAAKYRELIEPLLPDLGIWRGNYDGVRGIVLP